MKKKFEILFRDNVGETGVEESRHLDQEAQLKNGVLTCSIDGFHYTLEKTGKLTIINAAGTVTAATDRHIKLFVQQVFSYKNGEMTNFVLTYLPQLGL